MGWDDWDCVYHIDLYPSLLCPTKFVDFPVDFMVDFYLKQAQTYSYAAEIVQPKSKF